MYIAKEIKRGYIFNADLGEAEGSVQGGYRPVVIVSNDTCNRHSPVVSCVPFTSQEKRPLPTHVCMMVTRESTALCEQTRTIAVHKLGERIGVASREDMRKIDRAIMVQFGLTA